MDKWNEFGVYITLNDETTINEDMISNLHDVKILI